MSEPRNPGDQISFQQLIKILPNMLDIMQVQSVAATKHIGAADEHIKDVFQKVEELIEVIKTYARSNADNKKSIGRVHERLDRIDDIIKEHSSTLQELLQIQASSKEEEIDKRVDDHDELLIRIDEQRKSLDEKINGIKKEIADLSSRVSPLEAHKNQNEKPLNLLWKVIAAIVICAVMIAIGMKAAP